LNEALDICCLLKARERRRQPRKDMPIMAMFHDGGSARGVQAKKATLFNTLIDEIVEVLLEIGGAAHRDTVIERIAARRGADRASDSLKRDLLEAFELHRIGVIGEGKRILLHLPFGEGSRRWALSPDAAQRALDRLRRGMAGETPAMN
jgi:hypothetical protein